MTYTIAERFKSIQGEGVYAGTPMAFIRFTGCSVGKTICQHCDTDFDKPLPWRGGGTFSVDDLMRWAHPYQHVCLTGGEPLDQDLEPLCDFRRAYPMLSPEMFHIETSGTKPFDFPHDTFWVCVSPKPGFHESIVLEADEIKVIVPGLGEINPTVPAHWTELQDAVHTLGQKALKRWPDLTDALRWAQLGKPVFLQPRNAKFDVDRQNLLYVQDVLREHPELRLSVQLHKLLKVQ